MKRRTEELAIFGGRPLFSAPRPTGQFNTPDVDAYIAQLREIYGRRWLTNNGHCVHELETILAEFHGTRHCIALTNAATGMMMLVQTVAGADPGEIIMPALAYRGLPHFARWAGHAPKFADVDLATHTLAPAAVRAALSRRTRCILGMPSFTSVGHIDALCDIATKAGVPIVFDSVDAVACTHKGRITGGFGAAEVFSLHASKLVNAFEGGYVTTNDDDLAESLRRQRDFNHPGTAPSLQHGASFVIGTNAKLNELHAALALLSFSGINDRIKDNQARYEAYAVSLSGVSAVSLLPYDAPAGEKRNFRAVIVKLEAAWPLTAAQTLGVLNAEGAAARPYFDPPLHRLKPWSTDCAADDLPITDAISGRFLQLPVGEMTSHEDIGEICGVLRLISQNGARIAAGLKGGA